MTAFFPFYGSFSHKGELVLLDTELLPVLAGLFEVTVDRLWGLNDAAERAAGFRALPSSGDCCLCPSAGNPSSGEA